MNSKINFSVSHTEDTCFVRWRQVNMKSYCSSEVEEDKNLKISIVESLVEIRCESWDKKCLRVERLRVVSGWGGINWIEINWQCHRNTQNVHNIYNNFRTATKRTSTNRSDKIEINWKLFNVLFLGWEWIARLSDVQPFSNLIHEWKIIVNGQLHRCKFVWCGKQWKALRAKIN